MIFILKDAVSEIFTILHDEKLCDLRVAYYCWKSEIKMLRWAGHVAGVGETRILTVHIILVVTLIGKCPLARSRIRREVDIMMYVRAIRCASARIMQLVQGDFGAVFFGACDQRIGYVTVVHALRTFALKEIIIKLLKEESDTKITCRKQKNDSGKMSQALHLVW
jgi:hypothetical protein